MREREATRSKGYRQYMKKPGGDNNWNSLWPDRAGREREGSRSNKRLNEPGWGLPDVLLFLSYSEELLL